MKLHETVSNAVVNQTNHLAGGIDSIIEAMNRHDAKTAYLVKFLTKPESRELEVVFEAWMPCIPTQGDAVFLGGKHWKVVRRLWNMEEINAENNDYEIEFTIVLMPL